MYGVLNPCGTHSAPTEAARRAVACFLNVLNNRPASLFFRQAFHPFSVLHTDDSSIIAGHYFPMSQIVGDLSFQFYFQNRCKGMLLHTLSPDP